eukprot:gene10418-55087_t
MPGSGAVSRCSRYCQEMSKEDPPFPSITHAALPGRC